MTDEGRTNDRVPGATDPLSASPPTAEGAEAGESELPEEELDEDGPDEDRPDENGLPEGQRDGEAPSRRPASAGRRAGFAAGRALVVLVAAGISWYLVVPTHHVVRSRLSMLVIAKPGVAAYQTTKPQAAEQNVSQAGLAVLTAAAKKSPNQTGLYSIEWSPSQTSAAGVVAFLLPNQADAKTAMTQLSNQQLGAKAYSANSLTRTATFTVPGVPGSAGSVFSPSSKTEPTLSTALFRSGRVVSLAEVIGSATAAKPDSITLATRQYGQLRQVEPGFTLTVTDYPLVPSLLWGVGAVLVAALVAFGPIWWRRRAEKRRLAYEAELASRVIVHGKVIVKHRR